MNLRKHKSKLFIILSILIIVIFISLYLFNSSIKEIVNIIFISFSLSYVLNPAKEFLMTKLKVNKRTSSLIIILIVVGLIIGGITVMLPSFVDELASVGDVFDNVEKFYNNIADKFNLNSIPGINSIYNSIVEKGNGLLTSVSDNLLDYILEASSKILSLAVIPIIIYYFMCDGDRLFSRMMLILPTNKREVTQNIVMDINKVLKRYISGQLYLCGIIGILTFILLLSLQIKFPLWIAIFNALFNIIPYFGPIFGMVPAVIVALMISPAKALWVLIGMILIQQIEGNILSPKITGDSIEMHPFVIIVLLLIGDKFGGFIGMIVVVPIAVVIKVLYDDINYYLF
ncbi:MULTISPECIES: AI-2E family transporter [Clostridium]|jgi:predicted PurR-regulated permease PerM|uniref:AI-2E family transporter n=3 Tax=Clostridium butyricum TaxID=1492 RepID=A0A0Q0YBT9_CLOBU|nr:MULTISPECIES: AI-2E family transporter [Clostridium]ETI91247.1 MAG: Permease [Clostridium butyricum DORA_1]ALP89915.1 permease [Clostridium butyricum]ALS16368.1 permease [Clostridium butyricum]ANF13531.1 AI-2E family transporter [Clostridium butyricum]AOR93599.1 AI-2E family transporter [Clostridium butyricum]